MLAGRLRWKWTIQQKSVTRSNTGDEVVTWVDVKPVYAEEVQPGGSEGLRGTAEVAQKNVVLSTRYRSWLAPKMRAVRPGRTLDIEAAINPDGRRQESRLVCTEVIR